MPLPVRLDVHDRVATLTLDRPSAHNAVDEPTLDGLESALARIRDDADIKALVVTGAGDDFCIGLDIGLLERAFADPAYFREVLERFKAILVSLEALPVPTIAAVNGLARAGGFELMLACDLVVVASEARVGDTHLASGIVPGGGATQRAPRKLGWQRACDLIFTGRWIDGAEAVAIGLALRCVPRVELSRAVDELTSVFRSRSRACLAATKAAMHDGLAQPMDRGLDLEIERFMSYLETDPHSREGYQAFVQGREPAWP